MKVDFPEYFNELAFDIGKARSIISGNIYKKGTEKYRGDKEEEISTRGVLGELIVRHTFYKRGIDNRFNPIKDIKPVVDWDCITHNGKYDIKTVRESDKYLRINKNAHENKKKYNLITHYLFVILKGRTEANIFIFPKEDIWNWEIVKSRYTDVYRKKYNYAK